MKQRCKQANGQGLVEYALILVLVAVVVIAILTILGPQVGNVFSRVVDGLSVSSSGGGGGGGGSTATVTSVGALRGGNDVGVNITVSASTNVTAVDSQSGQSVSTNCDTACSVTLTAVGPNAGTVTVTASGGSSMSDSYPAQ
jgi:pilus assembly protein Flp/PilA